MLAEGTNLCTLESREWVLRNVRFLGCTLWTDYDLFGDDRKPFAIDGA